MAISREQTQVVRLFVAEKIGAELVSSVVA
jgi:hypothetical protein